MPNISGRPNAYKFMPVQPGSAGMAKQLFRTLAQSCTLSRNGFPKSLAPFISFAGYYVLLGYQAVHQKDSELPATGLNLALAFQMLDVWKKCLRLPYPVEVKNLVNKNNQNEQMFKP